MSGFHLLPPPADVCSECAVAHHPEDAHNAQSFYYRVKFNMEHGRAPTWADAVAHCPPERRALWVAGLAERGVVVDEEAR